MTRLVGSIFSFAACAAMLGMSPAVTAQADYPSRPVKFLVAFPPGGAADTIGRVVANKLTETWGKQVVVENRAGASGIIATEALAKSAPDGYTFLVLTVGHAVNPSLFPKLPYDSANDFAAVAMLADLPNILVVNPSVPAKNLAELLELARAQPGRITYASSGTATTSHLAAALLQSMANIEMLHVPYKGASAAITDLVGGQVQVMLDPIISAGQSIRAGKLRALAVTTAKRTSLMPDLPTIAEAGLPGYNFSAWFVLLAPAKTPADLIAKVNADINRGMQGADMRERLTSLGAEPATMTPAQTDAFLRAEAQRWAKVVRDANIKPD